MPSIQIPNVGVVDLPDYAMQHTLESLYHTMAGMSAEQASDFGKLTSAFGSNTDVGRQTKASVDDLQPPLENIATSSRQNVKQTSLTLKQMQKGIKDANLNSRTQTSAFRQAAQVMRGAGNMLSGGGISDIASLLPGPLVQGINVATKVLVKFADTQRRLTDVGMGLGASIITTTEAVTKLNMPIFEFERIAGKYSLAIDSLGDSTYQLGKDFEGFQKDGVHKGAIMFSALSNQVRKTMEPFGNMGLTVTEINTYLGEYLESDRKRGVNAQRSFEGLTASFSDLVKEASAYAIDTGRNRKEIIKEQIETMSRQDTAGYSMRLRLKGEEEAAKTFSTNMQLASNEMFGRYGKSGSSVKEMVLQAVMSGRGLEATEEGSNFMSLFPEAASVLDTMIRGFKDKPLDPEMFAKFSVALKKGTKAYDEEQYNIQKAHNVSMGIVEGMLVDEKETTPLGRLKARWEKGKEGEGTELYTVGADLLKGNEILTGLTAGLQQTVANFAGTISGPDGLQPALKLAIAGVQDLVETMSLFGQGDFKGGVEVLKNLIIDNPIAQIFGLAAVGGKVIGAVAVAAVVKGAISNKIPAVHMANLISMTAAENIKGQTKATDGGLEYQGNKLKTNSKFFHEGVEYKVGKDGNPEVTEAGRKKLGKAPRIGKVGKAGTILASGMIAWETWERLAEVTKQYAGQIDAETDEGKREILKKQLEDKKFDILGSGISRGAGSALLTLLGSVAGAPGGPITSAVVAGWASGKGEEGGQELWDWMKGKKEEGTISRLHLNAGQQEAEKSTPTYGILKEIRDLLNLLLPAVEDTASNTGVGTSATLEQVRMLANNSHRMVIGA
jgi:hypothetical protein